ncbi:hypothetical protein ACOSQ2_008696 [Xanthoceras sorbifolium]
MGRAPCCDKTKVKRGPWSPEEDATLIRYLETHGTGGNWIALPQKAGLRRCGKSCRLRWLNYLRPDIKHGNFTEDEDEIICSLYTQMGSRWSLIASNLPGRTDNDVKNYWNTKLKKKLLAGKVSLKNKISSSSGNKFPESNPQLPDSSSTVPSICYDHHRDDHLHFSVSQPQMISSSPFPILSDMGFGSTVNTTTTTQQSLMSTDPADHFPHPEMAGVSDLIISTQLKNNSSPIFTTSSQEGGSSSVSADSSSLAGNINGGGGAVVEEDQGSILMDFSYGIGANPYNEFINSGGLWFQDQKASHHHDHEAALSYCCYPNLGDSSSYDDIKPPQGLNQSVINQY